MDTVNTLADGVRPVWRYHFDGEEWKSEQSEVVSETAITLFVNGAELVTAAVTAIDLKDWVIGFLAGERLISHATDLTVFQWRPDEGQVWVRIPGFHLSESSSRYLGSCCGQSRPGFFNPSDQQPLENHLALGFGEVRQAFSELSEWSSTQHSGGLHAAGLARESHVLLARADVGRHNALDKVYGAALQQSWDATGTYLAFSGRLSAEIVWKVRSMGIEAIVSNAAPTSLGIAMAEQLGITLVGFLRGQEMSVFTHPQRMMLPPIPQRP